MKLSKQGAELIQGFESCRLTAYKCPADVWTIAYGSTRNVFEGMRITQADADRMFREDIAEFEEAVDEAVNVQLNQNQFDALVSLAYNVGANAVRKSTLVRKFNDGDKLGAAMEFQKWSKANGERMRGLLRRRFAEAQLFVS